MVPIEESGRILRTRKVKPIFEDDEPDVPIQAGKRKKSVGRPPKKGAKKAKTTERSESKVEKQSNEISKPQEDNVVYDDRCSLLWIEKYKPCETLTFIGNESVVERLSSWLVEWKNCRSTKSGGTPVDSEDSLDRLSNCFLITGPPGVGKTSLVYYLAKVHGFKVIEVNASSNRAGKRILSQLQEATQSHHVQGVSVASMFATNSKFSDANAVKYNDKAAKSKSSKGAKTPKPKIISSSDNKQYTLNKFFGSRTEDDDIKIIAETPKTTSKQPSKGTIENYFSSSSKTKAKSIIKQEVVSRVIEGMKESASKAKKSNSKDKNGRKNSGKEMKGVDEDANDFSKVKKKGKIAKTPSKKVTSKVKPADQVKQKDTLPVAASQNLGLTISSQTIILFDDVDVIFDEDDGFWSSVKVLLSSSKKPIILTSTRNHREIKSKLPNSCEEVFLKSPEPLAVTKLLESICAEEKKIPACDLQFLVNFYTSDVRKCLLHLQLETGCCDSSADSSSLHKGLFPFHGANLQSFVDSLPFNDVYRLAELCFYLGYNMTYMNDLDFLPFPLLPETSKSDLSPEQSSEKDCQHEDALNISWLTDDSDINEEKPVQRNTKHRKEVCDSLLSLANLFHEYSTSDTFHNFYLQVKDDCADLPNDRIYNWCTDVVSLRNATESGYSPVPEICSFINVNAMNSAKTSLKQLISNIDDLNEIPEFSVQSSVSVPTIQNSLNLMDRKINFSKHMCTLRNVVRAGPLKSRAAFLDYVSAFKGICQVEKERHIVNSKRSHRFLHYLNSSCVFLNDEMKEFLSQRL